MKHHHPLPLVTLTMLLIASSRLSGALVVSLDMDPSTPGVIETTEVVNPGDVFTVNVVLFDDLTAPSPVVFDTIILETFFNDAGPVLAPGPTGPLAERELRFIIRLTTKRKVIHRPTLCAAVCQGA